MQFRFQRCWVVVDQNGAALMDDGQRMPLKEFWLKTPGHVIGALDLQVANAETWADEWRTAYSDWRLGR